MISSNQEATSKLRKDLQNRLFEVNSDIRMLKTKNEIEIQERVRTEMYEQIKINNISVTKRIKELQTRVKDQLDQNERILQQKIAIFEG